MVASSYPRFRGDSVGSFMEPIAQGLAARGHEVHLVAPWHPKWDRPKVDGGVHFHLFHYAPRGEPQHVRLCRRHAGRRPPARIRHRGCAAGHAGRMVQSPSSGSEKTRDDRPRALGHSRRRHRRSGSRFHSAGHQPSWLGRVRCRAPRRRTAWPLAPLSRRARWVTACSEDLRSRAVPLGAEAGRSTVIPYGVDSNRFRPDPQQRRRGRDRLGISDEHAAGLRIRTARQEKRDSNI